MKILYIVSLFPCWSETFIVREINALKELGAEIRILSLKNSAEEIVQNDTKLLNNDVIYPSGIITISLKAIVTFIKSPVINTSILFSLIKTLYPHPLSLLKSIYTWWLSLGMVNDIKSLNINHIHAHWATYPSTSALIIAKNTKIPFSFTSHAHDIFLEDHMLRRKISESKFSVTISNYNKARLSSQLMMDIENKMHVIHCGIDINTYRFIDSDREANTIIAVGRLDYIKGFSVLIEACKLYKSKNSLFNCKIIGNGPLKNELQTQINKNSLSEHVQLVGVMPQEQIKKLLSKSTLFVLPSVVTKSGDMDGIPVALMEAMATGLPVISTTVSGIPELIENKINGLIVEPENPEALAHAIEQILDSKMSKEYSTKARKTIETDFSIKTESTKLYKLINSHHRSNIDNV